MQPTLAVIAMTGPYVSLVLTAVILIGSPGPATLGAGATATAFGFRPALPYLAGSITGTTAVLVAMATGLASALVAEPRLAPFLLALSVGYLAYLAYRIATAPPPAAAASGREPTWADGFVLAVANPKAYAALGALVTGSELGLASPIVESLVTMSIIAALIVLIHLAWAGAGASLATVLSRPRISRSVNLVLAVALLASTVPFVVELVA